MDELNLNEKMMEMKVKRFQERLKTIEEETGMTHVAILHFDQLMGIRPVLVVVETKSLQKVPTPPPQNDSKV